VKSSLLVLLLAVAQCFALAPLYGVNSKKAIEGEYIVVFHQNITDEQSLMHIKKAGLEIFPEDLLGVFNINDQFKGFSARLSTKALISELESEDVAYVDVNQEVTMAQTCITQSNAVWGIDRIGEVQLNLDGLYDYESNAGSGVDAYIIDTGIMISHNDFGGRAVWGKNFVDTNNADCNGHGTHVAGTVGGTTFGVAKKVTLIAVKVLNCAGSGTTAGVVNGIKWVTEQYQSKQRPSVANMSLGGGKSTALDDALKASIAAGVTYAVAAGNENQDACNVSPANVNTAITCGATTVDDIGSGQEGDVRSSFSNFGTCVSLFAPGELIQSAWIGSNTATRTISGTSMATPHVCGICALHLADNPNLTPSQVKSWLLDATTKNIITLDCTGNPNSCLLSPNKFAYSECD